MPAPGDQHTSTGGKAIANPFDPVVPQISSYTAQEIATLQSRLEKQLGPEYISNRSGPNNQKVHYLAAEKCIQLANEVFGFNGWSSQIMDIQVDFVDENPTTLKVSLGLSVVVRVTLKDGTYHEDIGYGHMEHAKGKAAAFEKAKKEGTTDGLKRALKNFGNVLGNCLYDKDYLKNVTKIKVGATKFDPDKLHRHSTFSSVKREPEIKQMEEKPQTMDAGVSKCTAGREGKNSAADSSVSEDTMEDEFGDFDEADFGVADPDSHPDEVTLPEPPPAASHRSNDVRNSNGPPNAANAPQNRPQPPVNKPQPRAPSVRPASAAPPTNNNMPPQPQTPNSGFSRSNSGAQNMRPPPDANAQSRPMQPPQPNPIVGRVLNQPSRNGAISTPVSPARLNKPSSNDDTNSLPPQGQGFFSARAATMLPEGAQADAVAAAPIPAHLPVFNPHAESPSIRKTPGVDHKSSKPLTRDLKHVPSSSQAVAATITRPNIMNPQMDNARRIGAPASPSPRVFGAGAYKPPTKRPVDSRAPLHELTSNGAIGGDAGGDVKRQRMNS
ncbi:uncharacterized protein L3040_001216 [Drepanopeziza brunnea f. sp. 'multigermtubi']|uniref:uncharacterized protein n=1 Tax=Drepanopeziza brunnea f. sp. 'multigermtubi' TaxID=698441 RepID=UPI0023A3D10F|nr:hypothetical protein L3040_001216 [Drepanopeziza brunnea f. sp. 'multigermtubi']